LNASYRDRSPGRSRNLDAGASSIQRAAPSSPFPLSRTVRDRRGPIMMSFAVETIGCSFHGMVPRPKQTLDGASDYPPSRQRGPVPADDRRDSVYAGAAGGQAAGEEELP